MFSIFFGGYVLGVITLASSQLIYLKVENKRIVRQIKEME